MYVKRDFSEYTPWSGAVDTYNKIKDAGLLDELETFFEISFPDEILSETTINDMLWFEPETVLSALGLEVEEE